AGLTPAQVTDALREHSRYPVSPGLLSDLVETMGRYGRLVLRAGTDGLVLTSSDPAVLAEVVRTRQVAPHLGEGLGPDRAAAPPAAPPPARPPEGKPCEPARPPRTWATAWAPTGWRCRWPSAAGSSRPWSPSAGRGTRRPGTAGGGGCAQWG